MQGGTFDWRVYDILNPIRNQEGGSKYLAFLSYFYFIL